MHFTSLLIFVCFSMSTIAAYAHGFGSEVLVRRCNGTWNTISSLCRDANKKKHKKKQPCVASEAGAPTIEIQPVKDIAKKFRKTKIRLVGSEIKL